MPTAPPRPTAIRAPHGADAFEIEWQSEPPAAGAAPSPTRHRLPHRLLRGYCPCAGCQGHSGTLRFVEPSGSLALELRDLQKVGQYALALVWGDGHSTGIYSFEFLHRLGVWLDALGAEALERLDALPRREPPTDPAERARLRGEGTLD